MAQREFYFAKGFSWETENLYCKRNFMILLQFVMRTERLFFVEKIICSKDYRLKEHVWLAIYKRGHLRKAEVQPAFLSRLATLFLKGRHSPAFSFTPCTIYHCAMMGKRKQAI